MATIVVTRQAVDDLDALIETHSLPPGTRERVRRAISPLGEFPQLGATLAGRWQGFRFILGAWRWMLVVYTYEEDSDTVVVVTVQDARSARSATTSR